MPLRHRKVHWSTHCGSRPAGRVPISSRCFSKSAECGPAPVAGPLPSLRLCRGGQFLLRGSACSGVAGPGPWRALLQPPSQLLPPGRGGAGRAIPPWRILPSADNHLAPSGLRSRQPWQGAENAGDDRGGPCPHTSGPRRLSLCRQLEDPRSGARETGCQDPHNLVQRPSRDGRAGAGRYRRRMAAVWQGSRGAPAARWGDLFPARRG